MRIWKTIANVIKRSNSEYGGKRQFLVQYWQIMKRGITIFACYIVIGMAINIGVAWICAARLNVTSNNVGSTIRFSPYSSEFWAWDIDIYETSGAIRIISHGYDSRDINYIYDKLGVDVSRKELELAFQQYFPSWNAIAANKANIPGWSRTNYPPKKKRRPDYAIEDARGWPFIAMKCRIDDVTIRWRMLEQSVMQNSSQIIEGIEIKNDLLIVKNISGDISEIIPLAKGDAVKNGILLSKENYSDIRTIPLCPVWPGFAINTLLYTGILWFLTLCPFQLRRQLRRHIRHRRGSCLKCGYDLNHADHKACPECGADNPS